MKLLKKSAIVLSLVGVMSAPFQVFAQEGTVDILTNVTGGKDEADMEAFVAELEALTGLTINMEKPANDYGTVLLQKLANGGEGLDLIYFGQDSMADLVEQEGIMDITDYVQASEILSDPTIIPTEEWDNIAIDGRIYAGFNKKEVHRLPNINQALMTQYGVEPLAEETLDGYYNLFTDMKEKVDVEGFYPINIVLSTLNDVQPWFASQGLKTGIVVDENGNKTVPIVSDESAPVWEWLRTLYAEELLDPASLTDTTAELRNKFQSGQTGLVVDWAAWTGLYNANAADDYPDNFEAVPYGGTTNPDGDYMLHRGAASLWGVPTTSDNVEGAIKVLETFATQEGGILLSLGSEGYDYTIENGEYVLTEQGQLHAKDHGAPFPISEQFEAPLPFNPGVDEAMEYLTFATTETYLPESPEYMEIVGQGALNIVSGQISVEEGLAQMQTALRDAGIID
ncbi:ABC transporter substrate-binding protein [Fundicoccus culcitae]|uniref:Extracellular solute-binding protein n=1 Tax=Fundicoccus culcitae TaxID=2969821 RepID=A0ABY5P3U5_9LACT|nr:extracellular solute-binding protein [Fundicoccus culcitae]UUX33357.1 extracellular solute-binding protein [Fundicoccus culcitae]